MIEVPSELSSSHSWKKKNSMINSKMILRVLAFLLFVEAFLFILCASVSIIYGEGDYIYFLYCTLINSGVGLIFLLLSRNAEKKMTRRDGYCVVSFTWLLFSLFGMLPFFLGGYIPDITNAFFETMSGFTTTGASILDNIESLPHGILFWRSLTQWVGGLGIVIFTIAIFPIFGGGNLHLFSAESTGVIHDKIHPKIAITAKRLWMVYVFLTVLETILLKIGGMSVFDAICHSMATTATGGYSTKQNSIAYWNSPFIEYVVSVFMALSAINFSLYFMLLKGNLKKIVTDTEFRRYLFTIVILTFVIMLSLIYYNNYGTELAFRKSLFQVLTALTSCGFATDNYNLWPQFTWIILMYCMMASGCTGSTSGGIKEMRMSIFSRNLKNVFKHLVHPEAVLSVRINNNVISSSMISSVKTFMIFYLSCIFIGWFLLMFVGVGFVEALGTVISSIGNVGPAFGEFGPESSWNALPDVAKWVTSFLMLIGRLELYSVLLMFYPGFWRKM